MTVVWKWGAPNQLWFVSVGSRTLHTVSCIACDTSVVFCSTRLLPHWQHWSVVGSRTQLITWSLSCITCDTEWCDHWHIFICVICQKICLWTVHNYQCHFLSANSRQVGGWVCRENPNSRELLNKCFFCIFFSWGSFFVNVLNANG